jgi:uncharacterized protein (DUF2336 family)
MSLTAQSVLAELDSVLAAAPDPWRRDALRRIIDLFRGGAPTYSDEQVGLFDEVIGRLLKTTDRTLLAEASSRLAPVETGPAKVLASLARHSDVNVCGPVLEQARALPDDDLIAIADNNRTDPKLLAKIASRPQLSEALTDILIKRGGPEIKRKIIDNPNARISEEGFARVITGIGGDKDLAGAVAARQDVPDALRVWLDRILSE